MIHIPFEDPESGRPGSGPPDSGPPGRDSPAPGRSAARRGARILRLAAPVVAALLVAGCAAIESWWPYGRDRGGAVEVEPVSFFVGPALLGTPRGEVREALGRPHVEREQGRHLIEIYTWREAGGRVLLGGSATHLRVEETLVPIREGARLMLQYSRDEILTGYSVSSGPR